MNDFFIKFNQEFVKYKDKEIGAGNIMLMVSTYECYMNKEISKLEIENKKLIKQNEIMREALNYYAHGNNYDACEASMVYYYLHEEQDYVGLRAKEALKKIGEV